MRILLFSSYTIAIPLSLRHRPEPYCLHRRIISRIRPPTTMVSTCSILPMTSKCIYCSQNRTFCFYAAQYLQSNTARRAFLKNPSLSRPLQSPPVSRSRCLLPCYQHRKSRVPSKDPAPAPLPASAAAVTSRSLVLVAKAQRQNRCVPNSCTYRHPTPSADD